MSDIKKTILYFKRNGFTNTFYAVLERLIEKKNNMSYTYEISDEELEIERNALVTVSKDIKFSIVVPVYETPKEFLKEMIESCLNQTYPNFELILGDASKTDEPGNVISKYNDERIKYIRISENGGISENTNACLQYVTGDYVALLDHDDLLTPNALYENARVIYESKEPVMLLYSDEDKCDGTGNKFFEAQKKPDYNKDLLFSNNYICHFAVIETSLIKELRFRKEFDGAQDYDIFLRAAKKTNESAIKHINKVLYHWRCHETSTASNPASKDYAYEAGLNALKAVTGCEVSHLMHKGFYKVNFGDVPEIFEKRPDIGAVGGLVIRNNKIVSGIINEDKEIEFYGMNARFSGPFHRAHLTMDVYALDIRNLIPASVLAEEFSKIIKETTDSNYIENSLKFAGICHEKGLKLMFDPDFNAILRKD